ncbi:MAG: hypothetical protein M1825_000814 [Sarcosagium campestre]|nr:MAG: hypothetical protein M1825_000814 [Sarcosagium campestre]
MTTAPLAHYPTTNIATSGRTHMVESPSSRFTAVNGRGLLSNTNANGDAGRGSRSPPVSTASPRRPKSPSAERPEAERPEALPKHYQRLSQMATPETSANGEVPSNDRESLHYHHPPPSHPPPPDLAVPAARDGADRASPHKRKRSDSLDRHTARSTSLEGHQAVKSPRRIGDLEPSEDVRASSSGSPPHPPNRHSLPNLAQGKEVPRESSASSQRWYDQQSYNQPPSYESPRTSTISHITNSDSQLADALRRESLQLDANQRHSTGGTPDDDDLRAQSQRAGRKRIFSNRTKTGCMTCRRRKKKCDELKPECNNCIRGGFVCEGYNTRIEWTKTPRDKAPVPLQSKDGETPQGQYPSSPSRGNHTPNTQGQSREKETRSPTFHGPPTLQTGGTPGGSRPGQAEMDRDRAGGPPSPHSAAVAQNSWRKGGWPAHGSHAPPYVPEAVPKNDYPTVPPLHELSRSVEGEVSTPHSSVSHRSLVHPSHSSSPQQAQAQAQLALQHQASVRSRHRSERDKMLSGELYFPNAPELVYERDRCKAALWRFNNSMNPNLGISREERSRLFGDVVQPRDGPSAPSGAMSPSPMGRVGENVIVEAPFNCDYGYNITIGADVLIGTNCTIMDTCSVTIGPRTVIGPNVSILTATMPIDPRRRKGSQGPSLGRSIIIEEDCWIGAGVIILPGRKVGKSSTVGAGSVVTRDVPRFTVVAGNPARVHRGIYANDPNI